MESIIYDYETLSANPYDGVILSLAALSFDESRYVSNPYTYEELLSSCKFIKFNVEEQVKKYNRKIQKETVEWWSNLGEQYRYMYTPSKDDKSITEIYDFFLSLVNNPKNVKCVYTRGNTFDPLFTTSIFNAIQKVEPFHWSKIRDTRSLIEGLSWGSNLDNGFMIKELEAKFIKHDPIHDISMDVMRMQLLARSITYEGANQNESV